MDNQFHAAPADVRLKSSNHVRASSQREFCNTIGGNADMALRPAERHFLSGDAVILQDRDNLV